MEVESVIQIIFALWLLILSGVVFWCFNYFRRLTKEVKKGNLIKVLEKVLANEVKNTKSIKHLEKEVRRIDNEGSVHIQKVGLIRFNPFKELGGDHSFSLCLLDQKNTGIILTGLHTRERTRVYIKSINKGKSEYNLSKEEERALVKAKKK